MVTLESLEESNRHHEARLNLLTSIAERQHTLLEELKQQSTRQIEGLEEQRRYSATVHQLWVRLCEKYGWLEDEDLSR
jgi:hypothetical protein